MANGRDERRLAAILAADIVGYSRLMEADESGTLAQLKALRKELIDPKVAEYSGRIVKTTGDGILVEFPSAVDAVSNALDIQGAMRRRNVDLPETYRIEFRIGINVGDVIVEGDDLHGDGVNLASRLEGLCKPGEVYVSGTVYDQAAGKLAASFEDLGEHTVKNISKPVRVYWTRPQSGEATNKADITEPLPLPDKPSIAVLPFDNMSGDPEQEFFADGITEDIITELARFPNLFVIARNSTFTYKGKAVKIQDVGADLGVQYVVEGSVRKADKKVRITVQLIDAATGKHVWSERFDRDLEDIFELQDEVTRAIVAILPGRVEAADLELIKRKPPQNMAAHDYVMRGKIHHHNGTPSDNAEGLRMFEKAIELDPDYANAHAWKACILAQSWIRGYRDESVMRTAREHIKIAYALDENDSECHRLLAAVYILDGEHEQATYHQERGLALNPNYDLLVVQNGEVLTWRGHAEEGIEWIEKAMRLNPFHPERFWSHLGRALYMARRYEDAIAAFKRITATDHTHHSFLAASHSQLGDRDAAKARVDDTLATNPNFAIDDYLAGLPYEHESDRAHHKEGLVKAGLPE